MNRRLLSSLLAASVGFALGGLAGRGSRVAEASSVDPSASRPASARHTATGTEAELRHDFASYLKRVARFGSERKSQDAVARMSSGELRDLLLATPGRTWSSEIGPKDMVRANLDAAAAAELVRREGSAAVDWAQTTGRKETCAAVLTAFCSADPIAAHGLRKRFVESFGPEAAIHLGDVALHAAAQRDAAAVVEVEKLWGAGRFYGIDEFAPGFDFGAVLASLDSSKAMPDRLVAGWVAADPAAAAAGILKRVREGPSNVAESLGVGLESLASMAGEDEAARWVAALYAEIPETSRGTALSACVTRHLSASRSAALIANLPTDSDRIALAFQAASYDQSGYPGPVLNVLNAIGPGELQVQALTRIATGFSNATAQYPDADRQRMTRLMAKLPLSESVRSRVLSAIPGQ